MNIGDLPAVVLFLVLTGMLLAVGMLIMGQFGTQVRDTNTVIETGKNLSTGTSITLGQTNCIAVTSVGNGTDTFSKTTYNISFNNKASCVMGYSPIAACALPKCNVTYTYGADNDASDTTENVVTSLSPIATNWLPLIVTVLVLAIILSLVINSFAMGRQ